MSHLIDDDDPPESVPHPLHDHNPWAGNHTHDQDGMHEEWSYNSNGGGFHYVYRSNTPNARGPGSPPMMGPAGGPMAGNPLFQNFATMLGGIMGPDMALFDGQDGRPRARVTGNLIVNGQRIPFPYDPNARLQPRDANNPQGNVQPVGDLNNLLGTLMNQMGPQPMGHPGMRGAPGQDPHGQQQPPMNPIAALLASMFNPAMAQHGDYVHTQEALDRVISQMMEQNAMGNAPGPASEEAINNLPKKEVTKDMLGTEGKAECSICMDEVNLGEEVTELPQCKHWFHRDCVVAWLKEHNTCPHCRQSITAPTETQQRRPSASQRRPSGANRQNSSTNRIRRADGSAHPSAEPPAYGQARAESYQQNPSAWRGVGSRGDPISFPPSPEAHRPTGERRRSSHSANSSGSTGAAGGGVTDRLRNWWSGSNGQGTNR